MPLLRDKVRRRTATSHAELEQTPLMRAFSSDHLSVPLYARYLSLQWQLHAPLEASLGRWLPPEWAALRLRKSEWLSEDLRAIGAQPVESVRPAGGIESWAQALGVLYVLEGSTLGLQVVRKHLQDQHPALQSAGRFMLGYGPDTGRHWRDFLVQFELLASPEWPLAEEAASTTFDDFLRAFTQVEAQGL